MVDQIKCLEDQFNSVNDDKEEGLDEARDNSVLDGDFTPIAKPNLDYKRVQKHNDKFNKTIEKNKKLLNQFIDMGECSDVNDLADKAEF